MGAWGAGSFENDDAMDWVGSLEKHEDVSVVRAALAAVTTGGTSYIEAPAGSVAIAAAEVVAALHGQPAAELPDEVASWVAARQARSNHELLDLARRAVNAVADDAQHSELRQLWDEATSEDQEAWRGNIADLRSRLL